MRRTLPVLAATALALAACKQGQPGDHHTTQPSAAPAADSTAASSPSAFPAEATPQPPDASDTDQPTSLSPTAPALAMAYRLGLVLPAAQVRPLMESHQEACERAGPEQCQVLDAQAKSDGEDRASAELTLRATPAWMRLFRDRAEADAKDLGGKINDASTEGDDLSKDIVDTEAAQRARDAERARLTELMNRRGRDLSETLQIEQEITRVQGEMDQASSELASMQGRVAMQTVTVSYESTAMVAPEGVTAPLAQATHGFIANVFQVLAALVTVVSYLLPFGLVAGVGWLMFRDRRPKAPRTTLPQG